MGAVLGGAVPNGIDLGGARLSGSEPVAVGPAGAEALGGGLPQALNKRAAILGAESQLKKLAINTDTTKSNRLITISYKFYHKLQVIITLTWKYTQI